MKLVPLFIIPRNSKVRLIHNKTGYILEADPTMVEKIRFCGMVEEDGGIKIEEEKE